MHGLFVRFSRWAVSNYISEREKEREWDRIRLLFDFLSRDHERETIVSAHGIGMSLDLIGQRSRALLVLPFFLDWLIDLQWQCQCLWVSCSTVLKVERYRAITFFLYRNENVASFHWLVARTQYILQKQPLYHIEHAPPFVELRNVTVPTPILYIIIY